MSTPVSCACPVPDAGRGVWWRIGIGLFLAGNSMTWALAVNISDSTPSDQFVLQAIILGVTLVVTALLGKPLVIGLFEAVKRRQITLEALFALSFAGAMAASLLSFIRGQGPVFFEVAQILLVVYSFGRELARYSRQRVLLSLQEWNPTETRCQIVLPDGSGRNAPVAQVQRGDLVRVHPGQMAPVDGIVHEGRAFVHEADLTGESFATSKAEGDSVLAGSHVLDATLLLQATAGGDCRTIDRITAILERINDKPPQSQLLANRWMQWFVPSLMLVTIAVFTGWTAAEGWQTGLFHSMAVLLVACPCVLGFATPLAVWTGIGKLSALGLLAKDGAALEKLAAVDTVVFDKTGTLTLADAQAVRFLPEAGSTHPEQLVRQLVGAAESASNHPIAKALRDLDADGAQAQVLRLKVLPGVGLQAQVRIHEAEYDVVIGAAAVLAPHRANAISGHVLAVQIDGVIAACIALDEVHCKGIATAVKDLADQGVQSILMTGDSAGRAQRIPIEEQFASLTPDQKHSRVVQLAGQGRRILYVGDGTNDAAAMAASSVSAAVETGSPLTLDVADFVWTNHDPATLASAIVICRETAGVVRSNLKIALAYNILGVSIAAAGLLHPVVAALLMAFSSALVTYRSLRLLPEQPARVVATA